MPREKPVEIVTDEGVACGAAAWSHRGRQVLTVVVKASFSLVNGGPMVPGPVPEIEREDRTFERNVARSLEVASDLAPYLGRCDVLFRGHAYAQKGQATPAGAARLALFRDARPLLDKTLHVFADSRGGARDVRQAMPRAIHPAGAKGAEQLFARMPIVYELAFGGPDVEANPVGTRTPNLVDPADVRRPAGLGPIAPHWPARRRLFGARRQGGGAETGALPDDLDWAFFQAAPPDQQVDHLRGGEWLLLDGLHPVLPRVQTRVPAARGVARVLSRDSRRPLPPGASGMIETPLELVADTLVIDGDAQSCTVTWRGQLALPGGMASLSAMVVLAGLESPERPVAWARLTAQATAALLSAPPSAETPSPRAPADALPPPPTVPNAATPPEESPRGVKYHTMALSIEQQGAVSMAAPTPFSGPPSVRTPGTARTDATPWGPPSVRSMPVAPSAGSTVTLATPMSPPASQSPPLAAPVSPPLAAPVSPPLAAPMSPPLAAPAGSPLPSFLAAAATAAPLPSFMVGAAVAPVTPVAPPPASATAPPAAEPLAPSGSPAAATPPPLVGPIQGPAATGALPDGRGPGGDALAAGAPKPGPAPAPGPALPKKLGKGNLGAGEVASFLAAFDLPPPGKKG